MTRPSIDGCTELSCPSHGPLLRLMREQPARYLVCTDASVPGEYAHVVIVDTVDLEVVARYLVDIPGEGTKRERAERFAAHLNRKENDDA
jgi:hypothetical protein